MRVKELINSMSYDRLYLLKKSIGEMRESMEEKKIESSVS